MNKREMGNYYETLACEYLSGRGIVILERNFRCSYGEIDIIGLDGDFLVFFEVKARKKKPPAPARRLSHCQNSARSAVWRIITESDMESEIFHRSDMTALRLTMTRSSGIRRLFHMSIENFNGLELQ